MTERQKCLSKVVYYTEESALDDAEELRVCKDRPLRVYRCPWCAFYHLTKGSVCYNGH